MQKINLLNLLNLTNSTITIPKITVNLLVTLLIAFFIFWIYKKTYSGVMYSPNFNATILMTTMVTAIIMMVIGSNLALSLGMVGALSIIRFRSAIKDPRDVGFLFWGVAVGLSAGTGSYAIAFIGSVIIAAVLFLLGFKSISNHSYLLIIRGYDLDFTCICGIIEQNTSKYRLKMRNSTPDITEAIYEIRLKRNKEDEIVNRILILSGIAAVNILSQNGEVTG